MTQLSEGMVRASRWAAYPESAERAPISRSQVVTFSWRVPSRFAASRRVPSP